MILMFPLNAYIATQLRNYQIIQMQRKDERVKIMNETLSGIKVSAFWTDITFAGHNLYSDPGPQAVCMGVELSGKYSKHSEQGIGNYNENCLHERIIVFCMDNGTIHCKLLL